MASSLGDQFALAADQTFRERVAMAIFATARNVLSEDPSTPNHDQRVTHAQGVLLTSDTEQLLHYAALVASDPAVIALDTQTSAGVTDDLIVSVVEQAWNPISGILAPQESS